MMSPSRKAMEQALRAVAVPAIRELGFTGSFPHFRRRGKDEVQFLMFGFHKYGGSFYVQAGRLEPTRH